MEFTCMISPSNWIAFDDHGKHYQSHGIKSYLDRSVCAVIVIAHIQMSILYVWVDIFMNFSYHFVPMYQYVVRHNILWQNQQWIGENRNGKKGNFIIITLKLYGDIIWDMRNAYCIVTMLLQFHSLICFFFRRVTFYPSTLIICAYCGGCSMLNAYCSKMAGFLPIQFSLSLFFSLLFFTKFLLLFKQTKHPFHYNKTFLCGKRQRKPRDSST